MLRPHVVHVLTVADSLVFIDTLVKATLAGGYEVTVVAAPDPRLEDFGLRHGVRTVGLPMARRVTPLADWGSLHRLHALLAKLAPAVVHAHTPKGGLLGTTAAHAAKVPVRIYHLRGLPLATSTGLLRGVLTATERLACANATSVLCQSPSLRAEALALDLLPATKARVVVGGSNGVDTTWYSLVRHAAAGVELRARLGIPPDAVVVGFVGRLVGDKGIAELLEAFHRLAPRHPALWLVLAGARESRDALPPAVVARFDHPRIRELGFMAPGPLYAAADLVALPSHREGFPNVLLEAAAMARPVISTKATGCVDAVEAGVTGLLTEVGDAEALAGAIETYLASPALRAQHGAAGRARVERDFSREAIAAAIVSHYADQRAMHAHGP